MVVAVRADVAAYALEAKRGEWGEILTISLGVAHLTCVHRLPNADREEFYDEVFQVTHADCTVPWLGIGDWNHTPDENPCTPITNIVAAKDGAHYAPTRWQGHRCIDYAVCTTSFLLSEAQLLDDVLGDHRVLSTRLRLRQGHCTPLKLCPTACGRPPLNATREQWRSELATVAKDFRVGLREDIDDHWTEFCFQVEQLLLQARARSAPPPRNQGHRPKGSIPYAITGECHKPPRSRLTELGGSRSFWAE